MVDISDYDAYVNSIVAKPVTKKKVIEAGLENCSKTIALKVKGV